MIEIGDRIDFLKVDHMDLDHDSLDITYKTGVIVSLPTAVFGHCTKALLHSWNTRPDPLGLHHCSYEIPPKPLTLEEKAQRKVEHFLKGKDTYMSMDTYCEELMFMYLEGAKENE